MAGRVNQTLESCIYVLAHYSSVRLERLSKMPSGKLFRSLDESFRVVRSVITSKAPFATWAMLLNERSNDSSLLLNWNSLRGMSERLLSLKSRS